MTQSAQVKLYPKLTHQVKRCAKLCKWTAPSNRLSRGNRASAQPLRRPPAVSFEAFLHARRVQISTERASSIPERVEFSRPRGAPGPGGRGTHEYFGVSANDVDIWTGSLAKAIPSNAGFAAVSQELAIYLQHSAAPFILFRRTLSSRRRSGPGVARNSKKRVGTSRKIEAKRGLLP
jgi:hypothetical protein